MKEQSFFEKWSKVIKKMPLSKKPKLKIAKKKEEEEIAQSSIGKVDILEQHKLAKERKETAKKLRKDKKEITGRK